LKNGFALVRPPGHHAEYEEAMGFCYFNSVAIAAKQLIARKLAQRVLIIDWAIHHGNGTQHAFYENPNVLYMSLHRHDHGNFYPGTGSPIECGTGPGLGFNINIAWAGGLHTPMADAEYLAAFRAVVLPIAHSFEPDIVLVSAGFDAAIGHPHPIGGYSVSTACFALLTLQLRQLAHGKVVLALEGGFNEDVLNTASEQCLSALLGGRQVDKISPEELARRPNPSAVETLQKTIAIQSPYWEVLRRFPEAALLSHFEAWEKEREQTEALRAMASLSMKQHSMSSQGSSCSIVDDVDADSSMT
jgi:histone deacetylase 4/5